MPAIGAALHVFAAWKAYPQKFLYYLAPMKAAASTQLALGKVFKSGGVFFAQVTPLGSVDFAVNLVIRTFAVASTGIID